LNVCAGSGEETSSTQGEKHLSASCAHSENEQSAPENGHAGWPRNSDPTDEDTSPPTKIALANGSGTATDEEKGKCASNGTGCTAESGKEYAMGDESKIDPDEESAPENGTTVWSGEESAKENEDLVGPEAEKTQKRVPENGHGAESEKESSTQNVEASGSEVDSAQEDGNASGSEGKSAAAEDKDGGGSGKDSALEKASVKVSVENAGMCMSRCRLCGEVMLHHLLRAHLKSLHRRTSVLNTFDMINTTYHRLVVFLIAKNGRDTYLEPQQT
jgi:hypothetical protein